MSLEILVNGQKHAISPETTLMQLLEILDLAPTKIAIERNLGIVPKSQYCQTQLLDGDRIEIVQFVGGG